jgi:hypothetical protein
MCPAELGAWIVHEAILVNSVVAKSFGQIAETIANS